MAWRWSWWGSQWRSVVRFHLQRIEWECSEEAEQLCLLKGRFVILPFLLLVSLLLVSLPFLMMLFCILFFPQSVLKGRFVILPFLLLVSLPFLMMLFFILFFPQSVLKGRFVILSFLLISPRHPLSSCPLLLKKDLYLESSGAQQNVETLRECTQPLATTPSSFVAPTASVPSAGDLFAYNVGLWLKSPASKAICKLLWIVILSSEICVVVSVKR